MNESALPRHAHARLQQCCELLEELLHFEQPADQCIERYFKAHRQMGSRDRRFAAETVYACLRQARALARTLEGIQSERSEATLLVCAQLLLEEGWSARALVAAGIEESLAFELATRVRGSDRESWSFADRHSLPDWLADAMFAQWGEEEAVACAVALNRPAPVDLRANSLRIERDELARRLAAQDLSCEATPYAPHGLRRTLRGPLFHTPEFREGCFELQDEGSQLIGALVFAKARQRVVDFCAGAGGKSLQLAATMRNRGELIACDIAAHRLDKMKRRLRRAGCDNVRLMPIESEHDPALERLRASADGVLVDAPCTGSGTLRRNPDLKWRFDGPGDLPEQQFSILTAAAALVRPGGRLVYATCSLLEAENESVLRRFLTGDSGFRRASLEEAAAGGVPHDLLNSEGELRLRPDLHGCDGFYGAVLIREANGES